MRFTRGQVVQGIITGIMPYGAFVKLEDDNYGLIHISEVSNGFVNDVHTYVREGEKIVVKIIDVDHARHQYKLSLKAVRRNRMTHKPYRNDQISKFSIGFRSLEEKLPIWIQEEQE